MGLIEDIRPLPEGWNFVLVRNKNGAKAAYQDDWSNLRQNYETTVGLLCQPDHQRKATMVGVLLGEASGGLLAVDHDGHSASQLLKDRFGIEALPKTATITSGKPGRFCSFYVVTATEAHELQHLTLKTGIFDKDGKEEALELRWNGHQQVVGGIHPETGKPYRWLHSPADTPIAEAPEALVKAMREKKQGKSAKSVSRLSLAEVLPDALPPEKLLAKAHRDLVSKGCSEGGRNEAGFRLAADLIGVEAWAHANGHRLRERPKGLFLDFCSRCSPPLTEREAETIWGSAERSNPEPCLSPDKLEACVVAMQPRQARQVKPPEYVPPQERVATEDRWFQFLGFNKDQYFYLPRGQKQVISISASNHREVRLLTLAPRHWWMLQFPKPIGKGDVGIDWSQAVSWLYEMQHDAGVYDPRRVRGRGCWIDEKRVVIHLGERVLVDGQDTDVGHIESRYIYEQGARIEEPDMASPMELDEARELLATAQLCRWEHPAAAAMLCGWVVLAPICGSLRWRPHGWLVGGAGSGKSTVLSSLIKPLLGDMATSVLGSSTEAGLRQHLGSDAIPVLMDEAEQAQARDEERLQAVMELARASSSETGAKTLKGTASGTGQEYLIRSMFLLSSITSSLKQGSDKSRFALLQLASPVNDTCEEQVFYSQRWTKLKKRLDQITSDTGRRLIARTIKRLPVLLRELEVFSDAAAEIFGSRRAGDQFGFLMAGAWSLQSNEEATLEDAVGFISGHNWEEFLEPTKAAADHERCLSRIMEYRVRVMGEDGELPLGELLEVVMGRGSLGHIDAELADKMLQRNGIKTKDRQVVVSANHSAIGKILQGTPWSNDWRTVLKQVPGADPQGSTYFRGGHQSRAIAIPVEAVLKR